MKKKLKKRKKLKLSTLIIFLVSILVVSSGIYFIFTAQDEDSKLTFLERQWIEKNNGTLIDFKVPNNLGILGEDGKGFVFSYLNTLESDTELNLNKISYQYPLEKSSDSLGIYLLKNNESRKESDLLLMSDEYVLIGRKDETISSLSSLKSSKIGILDSDVSMINDYFSDFSFSLKSYKSFDALKTGLKAEQVNYVIVPRYSTYELFDGFHIVKDFPNLSGKLVLRFGSNNKLNEILKKYTIYWKEHESKENFEESFMERYIEATKMSDLDQASLKRKVYKYGYIENTGYNNKVKDSYYGLAASYIDTLSTMADMEFEMISYSSKKELERDFANKKIDIVFASYPESNLTGLKTTSDLKTNYVVLSPKQHEITSYSGLNNQKIYIDLDSSLKQYLEKLVKASFVSNKDINNITSDDFLVLDELTYIANKRDLYANYEVVFTASYESSYAYYMQKNEVVLNKLLNYVLNNTSKSDYFYTSLVELDEASNNQYNFRSLYITIVIVVISFFIFIGIVFVISKKNKFTYKKEDVLKYNDMLTSLKNRNYLNAHINEWDDTKIFPRTIIIADLNNLKYVNDNYGHEEGNDLIKKAAAILINTQLEKSEIIRTDGNEFLIYLIGYSKTQVATYVSKLSKEFEKLPHGFGAAIGYSMIEDEISTIDDAINEATIQMRIDKEKNFR